MHRIWRWVCTSSLLISFLAGCAPLSASKPVPTFIPPPTVAVSISDNTYIVRRGSIVEILQVRGRVIAVRESLLFFPVSGWLKAFHVSPGEQVAGGTLLAELEAPALERELMSAEHEARAASLLAEQARKQRAYDEVVLVRNELKQGRKVQEAEQSLRDNELLAEQARKQRAYDEVVLVRNELIQSRRVQEAEQSLADNELRLASAQVQRRSLDVQIRSATFAFTQTRIAQDRSYWSFKEISYAGGGSEYEDRLMRLEQAERAFRAAEAEIERLKIEKQRNALDISRLEKVVEDCKARLENEREVAELLAQEHARLREIYRSNILRLAKVVEDCEARLEAERQVAELLAQEHARLRETYRSSILLAEEREKHNSALLARAQERYTSTRMRAPFSGTAVSIDAKPGDYLEPFESIGAIADPSELEVEVAVPEGKIESIGIGQTGAMVLDAYPQNRYQGTVKQISTKPTTWQGKTVYNVRLSFDRPEEVPAVVRMGAEVEIVTRRKDDVLLVPVEAIYTEGDESFVEVLSGGGRRRVNVEPGISDGRFVEIVSGLREGDELTIS